MGLNDSTGDGYIAANSTRVPYLPPCTPEQARAALGGAMPGLGYVLQSPAMPRIPGMADVLGPRPQVYPKIPSLAAGLQAQGIWSLPNCDPRLVDVTRQMAKPQFQTPKGTVITLNKPGPDTLLPQGEGLDLLIRFADILGPSEVVISGGAEVADSRGKPLHSPDSAHGGGKAIDVSASNDTDDESVRKAALASGYTHGIFEIRPGNRPGDPPVKHWHLQVGPENISDAELYDLRRGPIRTKDYTKRKVDADKDGGN